MVDNFLSISVGWSSLKQSTSRNLLLTLFSGMKTYNAKVTPDFIIVISIGWFWYMLLNHWLLKCAHNNYKKNENVAVLLCLIQGSLEVHATYIVQSVTYNNPIQFMIFLFDFKLFAVIFIFFTTFFLSCLILILPYLIIFLLKEDKESNLIFFHFY